MRGLIEGPAEFFANRIEIEWLLNEVNQRVISKLVRDITGRNTPGGVLGIGDEDKFVPRHP
jgi:hypothetical protein